jgi:hypothetical protein
MGSLVKSRSTECEPRGSQPIIGAAATWARVKPRSGAGGAVRHCFWYVRPLVDQPRESFPGSGMSLVLCLARELLCASFKPGRF